MKSKDKRERKIGGMTRETLHRLLDVALDGIYGRRNSIQLAMDIVRGGIKAYCIARGYITREQADIEFPDNLIEKSL